MGSFDFEGFPSIFGLFFKFIFRLLSQERIHFGALNSKSHAKTRMRVVFSLFHFLFIFSYIDVSGFA